MGTLKQEADKLTNPSLQRGIIEVIIERGAREVMAQLPFKSFQGTTYDFVLEDQIGTGHSARDPYGTDNIPNGQGANKRYAVPAVGLFRHADVPKIDVVGKSDHNDIRADKIEKQAKKLAKDFVQQLIQGRPDDTGTYNSLNMRGLEYWLDEYDDASQKVYWTDTGAAGGTAQNLSLTALDDMLSRYKDERFEVIYTDRETWVEIKSLLNSAGGNTAEMLMNELFGRPMLHYNGVPIVILDPVGDIKEFNSATGDGAGNVTVDDTDGDFIGFSSIDVGRDITVNGSTTSITGVTDTHTVTVSDGTFAASGAGQVEKTNAIYACRFDEVDGVTALFHANRGVPANAGKYYGPIAGFDAEDLGSLETSSRYRTRLDYFGNVAVQSRWAFVRLSHYAL